MLLKPMANLWGECSPISSQYETQHGGMPGLVCLQAEVSRNSLGSTVVGNGDET